MIIRSLVLAAAGLTALGLTYVRIAPTDPAVQRSRVIGFPDAISVSARPDGKGSRLSIWSRSRYGQYDFGVNRARVERWLAALNLG